MSPPPPPAPRPQTYLIIGASRGLGLAFTTQLLDRGHRVLATARGARGASQLWALTGTANGGNLSILECDVADEGSVGRFVAEVRGMAGVERGRGRGRGEIGGLDVVVVNAGVLDYPGRIMEISFKDFAHHLTTNTIGPLVVARSLISLGPALPLHTLVFMSSDSGSAANFRASEDGFGAYAASKAALNQGLRHLAAELQRAAIPTTVLALHPGEVATDATNGELRWDVEGIISPEESVTGMLRVIDEHGGHGHALAGGTVGAGAEGSVALGVHAEKLKSEGAESEHKKVKMNPPRHKDGEATFWTWQGDRYPW